MSRVFSTFQTLSLTVLGNTAINRQHYRDREPFLGNAPCLATVIWDVIGHDDAGWSLVKIFRARVGVPVVLAVLLLAPAAASAQGPENILVVVNGLSPDSVQVGEYYVRKRRVPPANLLRIEVAADEQVARPVYEQQIEQPIAAWLGRNGAQDRILYIVLTKGVPIRIAGTQGHSGTVASVDSELTLLYRRLTGRSTAPQGHVPNPYFLGDRPIAEAKPFTHETLDIFLVTRLDAFTLADVIGLIDRGSAAVKTGRVALDERASVTTDPGNRWLERTADLLRQMGQGDRVLLETTGQVLNGQQDLLGYYSWGSNDPAIKDRDQKLAFVSGALAAAYVSTDGRTFKEPPAAWTLGTWGDRSTHFAGSPQSLAGDLIRQGVTGVAGHVAEPYLDATIRPDVLFPAYVSGSNLAESFYMAMPFLSWQTVVIGDPLAAPFRARTLAAGEIDRGLDRATELPTFFSARALQALGAQAQRSEAAPLLLRARARLSADNTAGAMESLEQAVTADPRLLGAHLLLASLYERGNNYPRAIERYRSVVAVAPDNVVALNNLAFALAQHGREALPEALALARRANTLAPGNGSILDTLAWIQHLSGDNRSASSTVTQALRLTPGAAEGWLHAAQIEAALGNAAVATRHLARALELDPNLQSKPEVRELRRTLPPPVPGPTQARPGTTAAPAPATRP